MYKEGNMEVKNKGENHYVITIYITVSISSLFIIFFNVLKLYFNFLWI